MTFRFSVIQGGAALTPGKSVQAVDVIAECRRRIDAIGYPVARAKSLMTGVTVPSEIEYLRMQIEFVAASLAKVDTIAPDYMLDKYWPS